MSKNSFRYTLDVIGVSDRLEAWIRGRLASVLKSLLVAKATAVLVITPISEEGEDVHEDKVS